MANDVSMLRDVRVAQNNFRRHTIAALHDTLLPNIVSGLLYV